MGELTGLHIVIVPAWWPSAEQPSAGVFFQDYACIFADAGARVGVLYPDLVRLRYFGHRPYAPLVPRVEQEFLRDDIPVIRIRGFHTALGQPRLQLWRFQAWLRRALGVYRSLHGEPDVILAMCSIPAGWAAVTLDDPISARVVLAEHFGPFSSLLTPRHGEAYVRESLKRASVVVTVSDASRADMRHAGIGREIEVVGNPVGREFLNAAIPTEPRRGPLRGLYVGRLTVEKGLRELAGPAAELSGATDLHWTIVGDGQLFGEVRQCFAARGRAHTCRFAGEAPRSVVAEEMLDADFLVMPSHGETFGLVAAEALCVGLPVIVTKESACASFVDESNGLIVDARSSVSLSAGLKRMLVLARRFDRAAIARRARERFSAEPLIEKYGELFRRVVGASREGMPP